MSINSREWTFSWGIENICDSVDGGRSTAVRFRRQTYKQTVWRRHCVKPPLLRRGLNNLHHSSGYFTNIWQCTCRFSLSLATDVDGFVVGACVRVQSEVQGRQIYNRSCTYDKGQWLGLTETVSDRLCHCRCTLYWLMGVMAHNLTSSVPCILSLSV